MAHEQYQPRNGHYIGFLKHLSNSWRRINKGYGSVEAINLDFWDLSTGRNVSNASLINIMLPFNRLWLKRFSAVILPAAYIYYNKSSLPRLSGRVKIAWKCTFDFHLELRNPEEGKDN